MRFSILIPVYNVEKYLLKCLNSIDRQSYKDYEVILVDDGSEDCSGKICDEFAKDKKNVEVIHKRNQGLISARRIGINKAKGEYCIFCDSDDYLEDNALEELNKIIERYKADLILYNAYLTDGRTKKVFFENVLPEGIISDKILIYNEFLTTYRLNPIWIKAVKTNIIDSHRDYSEFYNCNYGEDLLQSIPIVKKAQRIYYCNKFLYNYRMMSGMMHKYNSNYYWSYRKINLETRRQLENEKIVDFDEKIATHLLVAAYGGITQLKYVDSFPYDDIEKIVNDEEFRRAWNIIWKKNRKLLTKKQTLILTLLNKKKYKFIWFILKLRK